MPKNIESSPSKDQSISCGGCISVKNCETVKKIIWEMNVFAPSWLPRMERIRIEEEILSNGCPAKDK